MKSLHVQMNEVPNALVGRYPEENVKRKTFVPETGPNEGEIAQVRPNGNHSALLGKGVFQVLPAAQGYIGRRVGRFEKLPKAGVHVPNQMVLHATGQSLDGRERVSLAEGSFDVLDDAAFGESEADHHCEKRSKQEVEHETRQGRVAETKELKSSFCYALQDPVHFCSAERDGC